MNFKSRTDDKTKDSSGENLTNNSLKKITESTENISHEDDSSNV